MKKARLIAIGGWLSNALAAMTRGWFGGIIELIPSPDTTYTVPSYDSTYTVLSESRTYKPKLNSTYTVLIENRAYTVPYDDAVLGVQ